MQTNTQTPIYILACVVICGCDLEKGDGMDINFRTAINTADYQAINKPNEFEKGNWDKIKKNGDIMLSMDLLRNYPAGFNVLPVANPRDVVNVSLQLALYHIVDMNEKAQTLTTNCEIITKWHDVFLMWDPVKYDNITDTRLPWDKVWTPDIVLYNAAGDGEQGREMRTLIQVTYDGNVTLLTQAIYMSKCMIDVTYYPFDAQICELKFASWTTEVTRINMSIGNIDKEKVLGLYSPSGVFELKKIHAERHEQHDPCCLDKFADVTYYLLIWRRPKFFLFNYIQPAVLINILALFVFLIPAESGEKITLGISTMLNMTVFLMTVTSGIPPTDQTPILSMYYATVMVLTTAATVTGVLVLRIHHQGRRGIPVPNYLRKTAYWMALVTFSKYPDVNKQLENLSQGIYRPSATRPIPYCYNIKEKLSRSAPTLTGKATVLSVFKKRKNIRMNSDIRPMYSPRFKRPKIKIETEEKNRNSLYPPDINDNISDSSDLRSEDDITEETTVPKLKRRDSLWKRVTRKVSKDNTKDKQPKEKDRWKDISTLIMEERFKAEERKEIIGEEWRKISRVLDRFLLVLFFLSSLIATIWCIFTSPHFPDNSNDEDLNQYIYQKQKC